jgi:hypothetical protein
MTESGVITGRLLDYEYAIDVDDDDLRRSLEQVLVDSLVDVAEPESILIRQSEDGRFDITAAGVVMQAGLAPATVLDTLIWSLNRRSTARRPGSPGPGEVMIHAGAVESAGAGVLLVGASGSGKTTASIGAALRGFRFLTDDIVAVDRSGAVRGSRKPIGLRRGAAAVLGFAGSEDVGDVSSRSSRPVAASSLGVQFADAARVKIVLFPDRQGRPGEMRPISRAVALQRLTGNCFDPVPLSPPDVDALAILVRSATTLEWTHGPLSDLANALRDLLEKG